MGDNASPVFLGNNLKEEDILQKWNSIDGNQKYFFWRKRICRETKTTF
jgi:hypothetical protein